MSADENLRADDGGKETAIRALITRIEAHEDEGADIRVAQEGLGLDAKAVKTIRKAKADAQAAQKTLDALMAGNMLPAGVSADVLPAPAQPRAPRARRTPTGDQ